jgi:hypothetical protein
VHWGDIVDKNQPIALMGNTGIVRPEPTFSDPYGGVHLHLTLEKRNDIGQWVKVDPFDYIEWDNIVVGEDIGVEADIPPLAWVVSRAKESVQEIARLIGLLKVKEKGYDR